MSIAPAESVQNSRKVYTLSYDDVYRASIAAEFTPREYQANLHLMFGDEDEQELVISADAAYVPVRKSALVWDTNTGAGNLSAGDPNAKPAWRVVHLETMSRGAANLIDRYYDGVVQVYANELAPPSTDQRKSVSSAKFLNTFESRPIYIVAEPSAVNNYLLRRNCSIGAPSTRSRQESVAYQPQYTHTCLKSG